MPDAKQSELLTVSEAAKRVRVSRQTIYTWIREGRLKPVSTPGGRLRIPEDQLVIPGPEFRERIESGLFPIRDISDLDPTRIEQLGTKEKYWFPRTEKHWYWDIEADEFLYKAGREGTGDNWAERVACELCRLLGLPHAEYDLATYKKKKGVISPKFVPQGAWLVLGNEILASYVRGYERLKRYKQTQHTLRIVLAVVCNERVQLPIGWPSPAENITAADVFTGYLMLDAWIGNTDRHHENWGLVVLPREGRTHLAPTFDHASSMGRIESDQSRQERMTTRDAGRTVEAYVKRARSAFYRIPADARPMSTLEAFVEAARRRREAAEFWLGKLQLVLPADTVPILDRVPKYELSDTGKEFTQKILELNKQRLLATKL